MSRCLRCLRERDRAAVSRAKNESSESQTFGSPLDEMIPYFISDKPEAVRHRREDPSNFATGPAARAMLRCCEPTCPNEQTRLLFRCALCPHRVCEEHLSPVLWRWRHLQLVCCPCHQTTTVATTSTNADAPEVTRTSTTTGQLCDDRAGSSNDARFA